MTKLCFKDFEAFMLNVVNVYSHLRKVNKFNDVAIIAKYDDAREILQILMKNSFSLRSIDFHDSYEDEYIITIANLYNDGDGVYCESMKKESGYINDTSNVIFVLNNCSSTVLKHCNSKYLYEVEITYECQDDEECDCDCEDCDDFFSCPFVGSGSLIDTSGVSSTYKINGETVSKEEYEEKRNEIDDVLQMYTDTVKDMLLRYCNVMDKFNDLQRMFW